jgi:hypothetical protein
MSYSKLASDVLVFNLSLLLMVFMVVNVAYLIHGSNWCRLITLMTKSSGP